MKCNEINNKKVLFITTKNIDYIRNVQEIRILKNNGNAVNCIYSKKKNYIIRIVEIYFKLLFLKMRNYDVVFIGFAPQLILPLWKKKFQNKYLMIDFFISVYDTLVFDRKKVEENSQLARLLKKIDRITLHSANHVIADTKTHGKYFVDKFFLEVDKLEVMYLEADETIYYPRKQKKREDLRDKFVVLYFGSILPLQGVDIVLEAVKQLKESGDFYFQIIGPINKKLEKPVSDNVEYIKWLPQESLAEYIANADLCLAGHFSNDIDKANRTIPGKAFIYEAMKKKMILGDSEANREIYLRSNQNVAYIIMGNPMMLVYTIKEIRLEFWKGNEKDESDIMDVFEGTL